jgi:hypothetical protein
MNITTYLSLALVAALATVTGCSIENKKDKDKESVTTAGNPEEEGTTKPGTKVKPVEGAFLGLGVRQAAAGLKLLQEEEAPNAEESGSDGAGDDGVGSDGAGEPVSEEIPAGAEVVLQQFKIDNSIVAEVPIASDVSQVTWGADGRVFGISNFDAFELNPNTGAPTALDISKCDSRISWLDGITWDSKRGRLLVSSGWADGLLCAYDPAAKTWKLVGEFEAWQSYLGIVYDAAADNLIVAPGDDSNPNVSVATMIKRISAEDASLVAGSEVTLSEKLRVVHSWFNGGVQFNLSSDTLIVRSIFAADGKGGMFGNQTMHTEIRQVNVKDGVVTTMLSTLNDEIAKHTKPHAADGNIILLGNYEGGDVTLDIDVAIDNLKIGIVSYEAITVNLTGAHKDKVTAVEVIGYEPGSTVSGIASNLIKIKSGSDAPATTYDDPNGSSDISCVSSTGDGGGCASMGQVEAYFREYFAGTVRLFNAKYGAYTGTLKLSVIKDGSEGDGEGDAEYGEETKE